MTVIGETLRRERQRRSLDLDQISRQTKISVRLLEAIENEQFDKLPGGVFTKSFVKQYARALGLDEDEIGTELERLLQPPVAVPGAEAPEPAEPAIRLPRVTEWGGMSSRSRENSPLAALAMTVVVMLVCSVIYAWWQRSRHTNTPPRETAAAVQPAQPGPAAPPPSAVPAPAQEVSPVASVPLSQASPATGQPDTPAAAPAPAPAAPAGPLGDPSGPVQVTLKATEPVWVKGWVDGKVLLVATLQPNETRTLGANETVRLRLGNAGGVVVELNGKDVGSVGPRGQIRVVELTARGMEIIPTAPPALPDHPDIL